MDKLKNPTLIIFILLVVIVVLTTLLNMKSKEITSLKAERDLQVQREKSKVVDEVVESAQKEINQLDKQMKVKPKDDDEFWKEYTK